MTAVNGHSIGYQYDGLQRQSYRHINSGKTGGGMWEGYEYVDGKTTNSTTTQVHNKRNWINDSVLSNAFFFEYDGNGNITKETRRTYVAGPSPQAYTDTVTRYVYDDLNQLVQVSVNNVVTETYTYDTAGNILTFNNGTASHTMTYGNAQWKDLLTAVDNQPITYDASGNPLTYYDGSTMVWGEGRNLQSITKNGQTHSYLYDADGLRIRKTNPDDSYILYHLTNGRYLGESHYNALGQHQKDIRYTYDQNETVIGIGIRNSTTAAWTEYYFEKSLQGDIIAVYTAENGANGLPELVASYTYDSWGNILSATGSLAQTNPFRYRGYYFDSETQFYYLRSRYYNPAIARFLNGDKLYSTGQGILGYNMFAYCGNNPVMRTDPTGMLHDMHGGGGFNYEGPTYIPSQNDEYVGKQPFGLSTVKKSGCGAIAIYNALITMGKPKSLRKILRYFNEKTSDRTLLGGHLGTTPDIVMQFFKDNCYQVAYTSDPEIADALSQTADACILYYVYEGQYPVKFFGITIAKPTLPMYHFFEYHSVDGGYVTVNEFSSGGFRFTKNPLDGKEPFVAIFISK